MDVVPDWVFIMEKAFLFTLKSASEIDKKKNDE